MAAMRRIEKEETFLKTLEDHDRYCYRLWQRIPFEFFCSNECLLDAYIQLYYHNLKGLKGNFVLCPSPITAVLLSSPLLLLVLQSAAITLLVIACADLLSYCYYQRLLQVALQETTLDAPTSCGVQPLTVS